MSSCSYDSVLGELVCGVGYGDPLYFWKRKAGFSTNKDR